MLRHHLPTMVHEVQVQGGLRKEVGELAKERQRLHQLHLTRWMERNLGERQRCEINLHYGFGTW